MSNKYLLSFDLDMKRMGVDKYNFLYERKDIQNKMDGWCRSRTGHGQGYPHWKFAEMGSYAPKTKDGDWICLYNGIYIFDDADRVAFKLTFGL